MKLVVLIFAVLCLWLRLAMGDIGTTPTPQLSWDHSGSNVVAYQLHYGQTARTTNDPIYNRSYTATSSVPRFFTSTSLSGIEPGIWFMSVTAIASNNIASLYSNEVCYTNRGTAPTTLRMIFLGNNQVLQGADTAAGPWNDLAELTNPPVQLSTQQKQLFRLKMLTNAPPPLP